MKRPYAIPRRRRGFALLAVLWVVTAMALLGSAVNRSASESIGTAQNRVDAARARWEVEGCLAETLSRLDMAMSVAADVAAEWDQLDRTVAAASPLAGCRVTLVPAGIALDLNVVDAAQLTRLFLAEHVSPDRADSLTSAILDWRDADDIERHTGAEGAWYSAHGRRGPRNAPFAAAGELRIVRGFESASVLDTLLDVEPGRILLSAAPAAVLASLPGFGTEAVQRIQELSAHGSATLLQLSAALSPDARALLQAHIPELQSLVTVSPDAWIMTARASRGTHGTTSAELRIVRSGRRAAVLRHRSRPWA